MALHFKAALRALRGGDALPLDTATANGWGELAELLRGNGGGDFAAKNCSTVFACVRILSDTIASLPLKLIRIDNAGNRIYDEGNPLYDVLERQPCPWLDKFAYWKFNVNCLLFRGMFASYIIRDSRDRIVRLVPIPPDKIDTGGIELSPEGELLFPIARDDGSQRMVPGRELFYCYYETLDRKKPVSPLKFARDTVNLARGAEAFGIDTLSNRAVPPGYYTSEEKLNAEAFERLRAQLSTNPVNSGRAPVLDRGIKYNTVTMTAEDMQMLETRRYQKEELCGIFGVPPHLIGDTAQAKGWSTMEQTMTEFLQLSLTPYLVRIENAIATRLLAGDYRRYAKFNAAGLLRGDLGARANFYKTMNMLGAMNANEIRAKEDLNAIEGGDTYYVQANMTAVGGNNPNGENNNGNE